MRRSTAAILGSIVSLLAVPQLNPRASMEVSAIGEKQLRLLLASKALLEKAGMLRAMSIFHYAPDSDEIEMDWTVILPPEDHITQDVDDLAQQVLSLVEQ